MGQAVRLCSTHRVPSSWPRKPCCTLVLALLKAGHCTSLPGQYVFFRSTRKLKHR